MVQKSKSQVYFKLPITGWYKVDWKRSIFILQACAVCLESNQIDCLRSLPALAQTHRQHLFLRTTFYCASITILFQDAAAAIELFSRQDRESLVKYNEDGEDTFVTIAHNLSHGLLYNLNIRRNRFRSLWTQWQNITEAVEYFDIRSSFLLGPHIEDMMGL